MADGLTLETVLPPEGTAAVEALGPVDALVAVTALNQARAAPTVVDAVAAGLARASRSGRRRSSSSTADRRTARSRPSRQRSAEPDGPVASAHVTGRPGRGRAVVAALAAARRVGARAHGRRRRRARQHRPRVGRAAARPRAPGEADYVSPVLRPGATEGTLTTNLLAPLVRSLFGKRLQETLGGCAGVSAALLDACPPAEEWDDEPTGQGAEMRLLGEALAGRHAILEVQLGRKQLDPGAAPADLAHTLVDAVGPLFRLMERHVGPVAGRARERARPAARPARPRDAAGRATSGPTGWSGRFHLGLKDLLPLWEQILVDETLGQLYPLGLLGADDFRFPPSLWARVVADFAVAHHERRLPRDHLLRALTPLYLGRVAAFVLETQGGPPSRVAEALERVCLAFEAEKAALSARWR